MLLEPDLHVSLSPALDVVGLQDLLDLRHGSVSEEWAKLVGVESSGGDSPGPAQVAKLSVELRDVHKFEEVGEVLNGSDVLALGPFLLGLDAAEELEPDALLLDIEAGGGGSREELELERLDVGEQGDHLLVAVHGTLIELEAVVEDGHPLGDEVFLG